jgi:hypothetical protein
MRALSILVVVCGIWLTSAPRALAVDLCTHPAEESSFLCGEILVELRADATATIEDVLGSCAPVGTVKHLNDQLLRPLYTIAVPPGAEVMLRDCYALHDAVTDAELAAFGMLTPNTAVSLASDPNGQTLLVSLGLLAVLTSSVAAIGLARPRHTHQRRVLE